MKKYLTFERVRPLSTIYDHLTTSNLRATGLKGVKNIRVLSRLLDSDNKRKQVRLGGGSKSFPTEKEIIRLAEKS